MAKRKNVSVVSALGFEMETKMDKTTRIVKKMVEEDAKERQAKINRLRNARLEREANTSTTPSR